MLISEEVVPRQGVVQERLDSGVQEARLAQIEKTTLALDESAVVFLSAAISFSPGFQHSSW